MLQRFVSAVVVPSILIAFGAAGLFAFTHLYHDLTNPYLAAVGWCMLPMLWGVWALLTPASWWPGKLAVWGGILGLIVGLSVMFLLRVSDRVLGMRFPTTGKVIAIMTITLLYAVLWMVVRLVYERLTPEKNQRVINTAA